MQNKSRLVKIDLTERLKHRQEMIDEDFEQKLSEVIDLTSWAARDSNAVELKVWSTVLKDFYLVDIETLVQDNNFNTESVLGQIDIDAQQAKIVENLTKNFEKDLDLTITAMVAGIYKRNLLTVKTQAALLSCKFGIEMEEILNPSELNIAAGIMMGEL